MARLARAAADPREGAHATRRRARATAARAAPDAAGDEYRFHTDDGEKSLVELFDGRSQLLVYDFMFGPSYQLGCPVNSSIADAVDRRPERARRAPTFA